MVRYLWRLWAKALGAKEGASDKEADRVATVRTVLILTGLILNLFGFITNVVIILGVLRHWRD